MHSAMQAAPLTIIFDLDGTLVDTAPDLLGDLTAVLVAEGHEPVVPKDLRHIVGHGAKAMFEHALLRTGAPVAPERLASLTQRFLAYYRANIARGSRPFPGVPETLDRLAAGGAGLRVCTHKGQELTQLPVSQPDPAPPFPPILRAGPPPLRKPAP